MQTEETKMVTILTPSYNRVNCLPKLYQSLKAQDNRQFIWLIVDDGSTDQTAELVQGWMDENVFEIQYIKQQNGGKHTALNRGIQGIRTPMTFIVDSDDWLMEQAVSIICKYYHKYISYEEIHAKKICGFSFLRVYSSGNVNTGYFPEEEKVDTFLQQRINNGLGGDKAEVFYTDILKQYSFEVFPQEKFMPEDAVWIRMSGPYLMVHANETIYVCDYLEGGLTKTGREMKIYSPYGMMYRSAAYLADTRIILRVRLKMLLLYEIYEHFAEDRDREYRRSKALVKIMREKCLIRKNLSYVLLWLPGLLIYRIWKEKYRKAKRA